MAKLIIFSLLSVIFATHTAIPTTKKTDNTAVRTIRATKNTFRKAKSYIKDTTSDIRAEIKDIAQEVSDQFKEVGTDIYDATLAPVLATTKKTASLATNKAKEAGAKIATATQNTYSKAANSKIIADTKEMGSEIKEQLTDIAQTMYENAMKAPATAANEKAAAIATAIREKIIAAKNATSQAAASIKNNEFVQDITEVGTQFKEVACDAKDYVAQKSTRVWDSTKATVLEIQEELAS
jgi:cation transport regulator ChaB